MNEGTDYLINGRRFSVTEFIGFLEIELLDSSDEIRFEFSGADYNVLKTLIEKGAGFDTGEKYGVSKIINLVNEDSGLKSRYIVVIRRRQRFTD